MLCYSRRVKNSRVDRERPSRRFRTLAVAGLALVAAFAHADAGDTLNFIAGTTIRNDDNLFRLPSGLSPAAVQFLLGKPDTADQVRIGYVGIQLDKAYSLQKFHLEATASTYRYQTYDRLNFEAFDYAGSWNWNLTQHLSGRLSVDHKQTQASFASSTNYSGNNTVTTENRRFDADWWALGGWHLLGGVSQYKYRNSQTNTAQDSFVQNSAESGARYIAASGSSLTLLGRKSRGEYAERPLNAPALLDTGFRQSDVELQMAWNISGKSSLNGRLTRLDRKHDNFAQRDYGGTSGKLDYTLTPTGKLQLKLSLGRDIAAYQENAHSYYVDDNLAFAPVWQIGAKTALRLNLQQSQRDYMGGAVVLPVAGRQDRTRSAQLSLDWSPLRAVLLTASLQRDSRSSNQANFDFEASAASITAQLTF
jgi:exopolysaccharide biosynthesis operon protein EpsL